MTDHLRIARTSGSLLALLLALPLLASPLSGQETGDEVISGVVESEAGEPVSAAVVTAVRTATGSRYSAETSDDGSFRIGGLPAGAYRLTVEATGYSDVTRERVDVPSDLAASVRIELGISPFEVRDIRASVPGNRVEEQFRESYGRARTEHSISGRTTESFNTANNYDALRMVPGVNFIRGSGSRFAGPSRIRGGSTWTIPDVIEGLPAINASGVGTEDGGLAAGVGATIPSIAIERIQVQKGDLGVTHGGNVDGGVIRNEIKRGRPGRTQASAYAEMSRADEGLFMADVGGGTETVDYYVAGKALVGEYDEYRDTFQRSLNEERFYSGLARVGVNPTDDLRFEGMALMGRDRIRYTQPAEDGPDTAPPNRFRTTNRNGYYALTVDHDVTGTFGWEAGFTLHDVKAERFSLTEDTAHRDRPQSTETFFADAYLQTELANGVEYAARIGVERSHHRQQENAFGSDKDQTFTDRSVHLANTVTVDGRLTLEAGLRALDAEDDWAEHTDLAHDLGASYLFASTGTRLRVSRSTSYSRNRGFAYFFGPIEEAGGVGLSQNSTLEAGVEQSLPAPTSGSGSIAVTGFMRENENVPIFSGWGAGEVYTETREVEGVEVMTRYPLLRELGVMASFAAMDTEVVSTTDPSGAGVGSTAVPVPSYTAALGFTADPTDRLHVTLLGNYNDGSRQENVDVQTGEVTVTTRDAYTRINLDSRYELWGDLSARLRVENLLNQTDLGFSTKTINPDGSTDTSDPGARVPGRFVSLGLSWSY